MGRKTFEVKAMVKYANSLLEDMDDTMYPCYTTAEYKLAVCDMITKILVASNNYNGYMYLYPDKITGKTPDYDNPYEFCRKYF